MYETDRMLSFIGVTKGEKLDLPSGRQYCTQHSPTALNSKPNLACVYGPMIIGMVLMQWTTELLH